MERKLFICLILHAFVQNLKSKMNPEYKGQSCLKKKKQQNKKLKPTIKQLCAGTWNKIVKVAKLLRSDFYLWIFW